MSGVAGAHYDDLVAYVWPGGEVESACRSSKAALGIDPDVTISDMIRETVFEWPDMESFRTGAAPGGSPEPSDKGAQ